MRKVLFILSSAMVARGIFIVLIVPARQPILDPSKRLASGVLSAEPSSDKNEVAYFDEKGLWVINLEGKRTAG